MMVNFLKTPNYKPGMAPRGGGSPGGGNRFTDVLRQQLAESAASRFMQTKYPQQEEAPQFDWAGAVPDALHAARGFLEIGQANQQQEQMQAQQQQDAQLLSQQLGIPIEQAMQIVKAPKEIQGKMIDNLLTQQKEERDIPREIEKEQRGFELAKKLHIYKAEVDKKYKDEPKKYQIMQNGLNAASKLNALADVPYADTSLWGKGGALLSGDSSHPKQAEVLAALSEAVAAAAAETGIPVDMQKQILDSSLQSWYRSEEDRNDVRARINRQFNPDGYEDVKLGTQELMQQNPEYQAQNQQMIETLKSGKTTVDESWYDWTKRNVARSLVTAANAIPDPLKSRRAEAREEFAKEYKEQTGEEWEPSFSSIPDWIEASRKADPELDKYLTANGGIERIADSIASTSTQVAMALASGGGALAPMMYGALGGVTDEGLDAIGAPPILKTVARIGTSLFGKGALNAITRGNKTGKWITGATNFLQKQAGKGYNKVAREGKRIIGNNGLLEGLRERLTIDYEDLFEDPNALKTLDGAVSKAMSSADTSSVTLSSAQKLYQTIGKRLRNTTDPAMKEVLTDALATVDQTIQNMGLASPELVQTFNMSNNAYAATKQLNVFDNVSKLIFSKLPSVMTKLLTGATALSLGLRTTAALKGGFALGGALGVAGTASQTLGSIQRHFEYAMNNPEMQTYLSNLINEGLVNNPAAALRWATHIQDAFVDDLERAGQKKLARMVKSK